jgi:hypothetical protein
MSTASDHVIQTAAAKAEKPRMDLLPGEPLVAIAEILTFGAKKHEPRSWQRLPFTRDTYVAAAGRHWAELLDGKVWDDESGYLVAAHLATNTLFVLWFDIKAWGRRALKEPK